MFSFKTHIRKLLFIFGEITILEAVAMTQPAQTGRAGGLDRYEKSQLDKYEKVESLLMPGILDKAEVKYLTKGSNSVILTFADPTLQIAKDDKTNELILAGSALVKWTVCDDKEMDLTSRLSKESASFHPEVRLAPRVYFAGSGYIIEAKKNENLVSPENKPDLKVSSSNPSSIKKGKNDSNDKCVYIVEKVGDLAVYETASDDSLTLSMASGSYRAFLELELIARTGISHSDMHGCNAVWPLSCYDKSMKSDYKTIKEDILKEFKERKCIPRPIDLGEAFLKRKVSNEADRRLSMDADRAWSDIYSITRNHLGLDENKILISRMDELSASFKYEGFESSAKHATAIFEKLQKSSEKERVNVHHSMTLNPSDTLFLHDVFVNALFEASRRNDVETPVKDLPFDVAVSNHESNVVLDMVKYICEIAKTLKSNKGKPKTRTITACIINVGIAMSHNEYTSKIEPAIKSIIAADMESFCEIAKSHLSGEATILEAKGQLPDALTQFAKERITSACH